MIKKRPLRIIKNKKITPIPYIMVGKKKVYLN
jgi:hypothetical protein